MPDPITQDPGTLLADKFYGTPETEQPTQPEVQEEAPPSEEAVTAAPEDVTPTPDAEVELAENDAPAASEDAIDDDKPEEIELATFAQLAEHLETEPEFLEGLTVTQKVNGEQVEVKIADALQTHRKVAAADTYLSDAKKKAKAIVTEVREQKETLTEAAVVAATMLKELDTQFEAQVGNINWAQLRADDPAEYSAKRQEVTDQRTRLDTLKNEAANKYKESLSQVIQQEEAARLARLPAEQEKILELVPEWSDDKKASAERTQVVQYLQNLGLTDKQIEAASFDATYLALAVNSMRYESAKTKSDAIRKKVITIPKVIKPGKKQQESSAKPKVDPTDRSSQLYGS